jgi:hypothetical protein
LAGRLEVSRAFLRREISLCMRAVTRARISATIFSRSRPVSVFWSRLGEARIAVSSLSTTPATIPRIAAVPRISFVCPSNCGSGNLTVTTPVSPARTSSFSMRGSLAPTLSRRALASTSERATFRTACSKPAWWAPPPGVLMMLTKDSTRVS